MSDNIILIVLLSVITKQKPIHNTGESSILRHLGLLNVGLNSVVYSDCTYFCLENPTMNTLLHLHKAWMTTNMFLFVCLCVCLLHFPLNNTHCSLNLSGITIL